MKPSGNVYYQDEYGQQYIIEWNSNNDTVDITTTTMQPYVWGKAKEGKIQNSNVYVKGIITVERQVIKNSSNTYTVVADGYIQYIDYVKTTFNCTTNLPVDVFINHHDNEITDSIGAPVSSGPGWYDPADGSDADTCVWCALLTDGTPINSGDILEFIDVWGSP